MTLWKVTLAFLLLAGFGACADVRFNKISNCQNSGYSCELVCQAEDDCVEVFSALISTSAAQVDILFVIDNSASMSVEQAELAARFYGFFQTIEHLNYRIAITTTDVAASEPDILNLGQYHLPYSLAPSMASATAMRTKNAGYYQNGKFLTFNIKGEQKYLSKNLGTSAEIQAAFINTLNGIRDKTMYCEENGSLQGHCASGDERGIYAMNMALENNMEAGFFRTNTHLAVVIVSDEDERSGNGEPGLSELDSFDLPATFMSRVQSNFAMKTLGVHSIVAQNSTCASQQRNQYGGRGAGNIGTLYMQLSQMTGGHIGSVCASNYVTQLGQIGSTVVDQVSAVALACRPINDDVLIEFISQPPPNVTIIEELEQRRIRFEPMLPPQTQIKVHYECNL